VFVVESPQLVVAFFKAGNLFFRHFNNSDPRKNNAEKAKAKVVVRWTGSSLSTKLLNFALGDSLSSEKVDDFCDDFGVGHSTSAKADVVFGLYL
jgi:hypothetical protein